MLCLKIVRGKPAPGFTSQEDITELEMPISISTLESLDSDYDAERKLHPKEAIVCLNVNGSLQYVYPEDSAYLINENGGTVKTIHRATQKA